MNEFGNTDLTVVLPTNDLLFKKIFTSPENKNIAEGLIKDFYGMDVKVLGVGNTYSFKEYKAAWNKMAGQNSILPTEVDFICSTKGFK